MATQLGEVGGATSARGSAPPGARSERPRDQVRLDVPADPAYLAVLRTASAGLAARLDLTLDEIEDLRIAVDEACGLLLDGRSPGSRIEALFDLGEGELDVRVSGPARSLPPRSSFAWAVLEALAGEVETGGHPEGSWIRLRHSSARRLL